MNTYKVVSNKGVSVIKAKTSERAREIFHRDIHGTIKSIKKVKGKKK